MGRADDLRALADLVEAEEGRVAAHEAALAHYRANLDDPAAKDAYRAAAGELAAARAQARLLEGRQGVAVGGDAFVHQADSTVEG